MCIRDSINNDIIMIMNIFIFTHEYRRIDSISMEKMKTATKDKKTFKSFKALD